MGYGSSFAMIGAAGLLAVAMAAPAPATAQAHSANDHASAEADLYVGGNLGVIAPQAFSALGSFALLGIEAGYVLPALERQLVVTGGVLYSQPPGSGGRDDGRLSGGSYAWELDQQMLIVELGGAYRIFEPGGAFTPFAYGAGRIYMLQTRLDGESGEAAGFGRHDESFTEIGAAFGGGVDVPLGPGLATGKLGMGISNMNQQLTGNTNTGAFELSGGYRMAF